MSIEMPGYGHIMIFEISKVSFQRGYHQTFDEMLGNTGATQIDRYYLYYFKIYPVRMSTLLISNTILVSSLSVSHNA
jgi:hypothetical protein